MEFQAVIMAAGRGSRMTDLTSKTPKALLPIGNMPMIWYTVQLLEKAGFEEAFIVTLESTQAVIQKTLTDVELRLYFVTIPDTDDWGTADSLRHLSDKIKTDVLLLSCDLITDVSIHTLVDIHRTHDATVTAFFSRPPGSTTEMPAPGGKSNNKKPEKDFLGLDENDRRFLFMAAEADFEDVVELKKSLFVKHPCINFHSHLLDGHLYILKKWVVDLLQQERSISAIKGELIPYLVKKQFSSPKQPTDKVLPNPDASVVGLDTKTDIYSLATEDEFSRLSLEMSSWTDHRGDMATCYHGDKIRCYAYVMENGYCARANSIASYCEANRQIPRKLIALTSGREVPLISPLAVMAARTQIGPDSMVGDGTTVAEKCGFKKSVVGKHCSIGERVKLSNCVIMDHVTIEEGCNLQNCVICENAQIGEKSELKDCIVGSSQIVSAMGKFTGEVIMEIDRMMAI